MHRLRRTEPLQPNPLIDLVHVKPFDPIARQATVAQSGGQGRPCDCQSPWTPTTRQFAASKFGRPSLALDGSEHGGRLVAHWNSGVCAVIRRGMTVLCACLMLIPSASVVCAEPPAQSDRPPRSLCMTSSADPWSVHVREAAKRFGIPERLLRAVMHVESVGAVHAVSSKGAMGLMQIMPATWDELRARYHLGDDPFQPRDNILAGAAYLSEMLHRFGRSGFLAAYNAGPMRYQQHLTTGRPLPRETIDYVKKLAPLINGPVSVPTRIRRGTGKASALDAAIFAHTDGIQNVAASPSGGDADVDAEAMFAAIHLPDRQSATDGAIADLMALEQQLDGSSHKDASSPKPTANSLFIQRPTVTVR